MSKSELILNSLSSSGTIRISVLLATHNRAAALRKCLSALSSQTVPPSQFEVLIGDDGSTDETEDVVKAFLNQMQIYYSRAEKSSISSCRNRMLCRARGEYVLFINDDVIAAPDLLEKHCETHQECEPEKACVMGKITLLDDSATPFMHYLARIFIENAQQKKVPFAYQDFSIAWTGNSSVRRAAIQSAGFFDEDFTGYGYEDIEYFYRVFKAGYRIYYNPLCNAVHEHVFTLADECRRWWQAEHNLILFCMKHGELLDFLTGFNSFQQIEGAVTDTLQVEKRDILDTLYDLERRAGIVVKDLDSREKIAGSIDESYHTALHFFRCCGRLSAIERLYRRWQHESSALRISLVTSIHSERKRSFVHNLCFSLKQRSHELRLISLDGGREGSSRAVDSLAVTCLGFSDSSERVPFGDVIIAMDRRSALFVSVLPLSRGIKFFIVDSDEIALNDKWKYAYFLPSFKAVQSAEACKAIRELTREECPILSEDFSGEELEAFVLTTLDTLAKRRAVLSVPDLRIVNREPLASALRDFDISVNENDRVTLLNLLQEKERILQEIYQSDGWKALSCYYRIKGKIFPYRSSQWRFVSKIFRSVRGLLTKRDTYQQWIKKHEPSKRELQEQKQAEFSSRPLISIAVPVFNTPERIFRKMVESVFAQTYGNWELCLALGGDEEGALRPVIERYMKKDSRVKAVFLESNKGIAGNTNEAIALAAGDYVGFLDHDDLLSSFALYEIAKVIEECDSPDFIYSDEDMIGENSTDRTDPDFKNGYSPHLLRSMNCICHFLVCRKSLGDGAGWLRDGYNGAQDYDFVLRLSEKAEKVAHIPKVLYHWRRAKGSLSAGSENKPYVNEAAKRALEDHMRRLNRQGTVHYSPVKGCFHISYSLFSRPLVSIIIVNRDNHNYLERCVMSVLQRSTYRSFEMRVVEHGSREEETFRLYERLRGTGFVSVSTWDQDFSSSAMNNCEARSAAGDYLIFLGNDTEVISPDWIERMLEQAQWDEAGATGAKMLFPDGTIWHAGICIEGDSGMAHRHIRFTNDPSGNFKELHIVQNVLAVTGECLMTRKALFLAEGGFDETLKYCCFDTDYCMRLFDKGLLNVWTPHAMLFRHGMDSADRDSASPDLLRMKDREYFKTKWAHILERGDPYSSRHLRSFENRVVFNI